MTDPSNENSSFYSVGASEVSCDDELPPSYDGLPPSYEIAISSHSINCQVCQALIVYSDAPNVYIVKCNGCNEHTFVRNPPGDKRHLRCVCHALLSYPVTSAIVICSRQNCKKVHNVSGLQMHKVSCAHCKGTFYIKAELAKRKLARCNFCRKTSAVDAKSIRRRACLRLGLSCGISIIGIVILALNIIFSAQNSVTIPIFIVAAGFMALGFLNFMIGYYLIATKVSEVQETLL